jgi:hypothetical protein
MIDAIEWFILFHQELFLVAGIVSAALFLVSLVLVPVAVINLPEDHFVKNKNKQKKRPAAVHLAVSLIRNFLGIVFLILGVILLVLPGPGWLTILLGIALLDFPFKHKLELKVLSLPVVRQAVDRLRSKYHKPPLQFPRTATEAQRTQRGKEKIVQSPQRGFEKKQINGAENRKPPG